MEKLTLNYKCFLWIVTLVMMATLAVAQPDISGKYTAYDKDTSIIILLNLTKDSIGQSCSYQLPLGGVMNTKAKNVRLRNDTLNIYLQQPVATISTVISRNGRFTETVWKQNGQTTKLQVQPMRRPQMSQLHNSYLSDSVEYDNMDKTVHLGATFTRPKGNSKKYAVAILITGSGAQDRDETIFEHKPFAIIADDLTKNGMAVLRVDDRMTGKSKGDVMKTTSADFAQDVLTSLRYLKTRDDVDTNKIGLIGHSEGGIISAIAYNQWPHFAFIISLAGTGVPGSVTLLRQQTDPLKGQVSKEAFDAYYELQQQKFATFDAYYDNDSLAMKTLETDFDEWKKQYTDSVLIQLNANTATGAMYAQQIGMQITFPWLKFFMHEDPATYYKNVKCPVLALNGEKDTQVEAAQNITAIKAALQKAGNKNVTTKIFPQLNHLFQHCKTGALNEYPLIEETFSTEVLSLMNSWLRNNRLLN